ncbi:MAG: tryptophan synthase subunit alpha [Candidatus Abyssobacteria bacterium SURF_17]|uniref:Tryptophan synthase alpha chain n=1 Tax=Candidatus Abyssobacteria bacterium SURF_17 TaxID=2093361 RepID=A0A419F3B4_9BACT|nr:MAG: tryptophan synthase subunit alpha [Candidatus Abyssubacteria bacterium SURF_17]
MRSNRITAKFEKLARTGKKGFIAYITAGDPDLEVTRRLVIEFDRIGVDVVELGVPFSDPLADGIVNQRAAERALKSGTTLQRVLDTVKQIRQDSQVPIILFTYFNPVHHFGLEQFVADALESGVDGALVLDLPPEESKDYKKLMDMKGLCTVYLLAPTSTDDRIDLISRFSTGFVYYVSREGVTGVQEKMVGGVAAVVEKIRSRSGKPVAVGFGIATPSMAAEVASYADAVVVGSAIVQRIEEKGTAPDVIESVSGFVAELVKAVKR